VDAEVAFAVEEDYHRQGIASCLLGDLDRVGRSKGLVQFDADVLAVNWPMLAVFARSRLPMRQRHAQDVIHVTLSLDEGVGSGSIWNVPDYLLSIARYKPNRPMPHSF
jgi:hypothetical protein